MPTLRASGRKTGRGEERKRGSTNARERPFNAVNGHLASALRDHVRELAQDRPGVYRMIGPDGNVVYVGKSVRLRTRLLSYFRADRADKATDIISATRQIEWEYVPSEFASLLLELQLIQRHRPPFNVQNKFDRNVCFIRITADAAPRLLLATTVLNDDSTYYGPFRGRDLVRALLREVSDLLQLRDCATATHLQFADQLDMFAFQAVPRCVRADLNKCLGPCAGRCTRTEYAVRVHEARRFLEGDLHRPLRVLQERMQHAAQRMQFEYAAELRDRSFRLEGARAELVSLRGTLEALTFLYTVPGHGGEDRVYLIRRGHIRAQFPMPRSGDEEERLLEVAAREFRRQERGPTPVDPHHVAEILLVSRWFQTRPDELARTVLPQQMHAHLASR
ncbi:MAG: GIY-YIG nuclease family protein [Longimicrobiales bacterium]